MNPTKNIKKIIIYRAYDILFLGYYEYSLKIWCKQNKIPLEIRSPKYANINYSPRNIGIRGQMYFEIIFSDKKIKKCFVDISDGYDDIRLALLDKVDIYFKCNNSLDYVSNLQIDEDLKKKIVPSSLFFPVNFFKSKFELIKYCFLSFFELVGFDKDCSLYNDILRWKVHVKRAKGLYDRPNWDFYENNNKVDVFKNDIFYSASTWYEVDKKLMYERAETIKQLRKITTYKVHAEFIYNIGAKQLFPDLMIDYKRNLLDYFILMNNSKIVVINKSLSGGAISWRVGECLALGKVYIHEHTPNDLYETIILDEYYGVYHNLEDLLIKLEIILANEEVYNKMLSQVKNKYNNYFKPIVTANYLINKEIN